MRTSQLQYEIMVEFMESNGDLSKPSGGPRGRSYIQAKWKELTLKLNSEGSGEPRSEEKWRKAEDGDGSEALTATIIEEQNKNWNIPGTSNEPTVFPPFTDPHEACPSPVPPPTPPTTNSPIEEETWKPPPAKKSKTSLIKMCVENDKNAREYAREREKRYDMIEQERLDLRREELRIREMEIQERVRQRDAELSLQAQWQEIMKEALNVLKNFLEKKED
uniref:SFRICE_023706 n=1 Tax=Spodoptera frugiperda TaxID=7108 RepID=A0A2H1WEU8_SPOFR